MKSLFSFLFFNAMFISTLCHAQNNVEFGVKVGYTASSLVENVSDRYKLMKSGVIFGGYSKIPLSSSLYFQPELNFVQKGGKNIFYDTFHIPYYFIPFTGFKLAETPITYYGDIHSIRTLSYLSVPLNINYAISEKVGLLFGGETSFLLNEKTERIFYADTGDEFRLDIGSAYKTIDLGLNFGVEYKWNQFNVELRYNYGLLNNSTDPLVAFTSSNLQFTLGYRVYKKKSYY